MQLAKQNTTEILNNILKKNRLLEVDNSFIILTTLDQCPLLHFKILTLCLLRNLSAHRLFDHLSSNSFFFHAFRTSFVGPLKGKLILNFVKWIWLSLNFCLGTPVSGPSTKTYNFVKDKYIKKNLHFYIKNYLQSKEIQIKTS